FSVEPVLIESVQITKSVNSETTPDGKKSSDTMGMKHRVSRAVMRHMAASAPNWRKRPDFPMPTPRL
ncbi:MAG: hypothetical protein ACOX0U_10685, partial [Oscillospiraceae bacterium]